MESHLDNFCTVNRSLKTNGKSNYGMSSLASNELKIVLHLQFLYEMI